mmetsp:Transcript_56648/g.128119  ORF Transcript_56648/g.128119 Transcript_56648/m.128119 type:complete len:85 (+) Transcript_56648:68-322(+)
MMMVILDLRVLATARDSRTRKWLLLGDGEGLTATRTAQGSEAEATATTSWDYVRWFPGALAKMQVQRMPEARLAAPSRIISGLL